MAAPITHIVLALKILFLLPSTIDKGAFIVGTSFPDIRYKACLDREKTRIEPVSWSDVLICPSSFRAGMLFHNMVDMIREEHFEPNFYGSCFSERYHRLHGNLLKMAEDVILYNHIQEWNEIINYFDIIYDEELVFYSNKELIKEWHVLLQNYFRKKPSFESITAFLENSGGNLFNIWINSKAFAEQTLNTFVQNSQFQKKLLIFYDEFESLLINKLSAFSSSILYPTIAYEAKPDCPSLQLGFN